MTQITEYKTVVPSLDQIISNDLPIIKSRYEVMSMPELLDEQKRLNDFNQRLAIAIKMAK